MARTIPRATVFAENLGLVKSVYSAVAGFAAASFMQKPFVAILCLMAAESGLVLAGPIAGAACLEVGGRLGGNVIAFMNTASRISAFISFGRSQGVYKIWVLFRHT